MNGSGGQHPPRPMPGPRQTAPDGPCAVSNTGVRLQRFDDGSMAVQLTESKAAMHFNPQQARAIMDFVRIFDDRKRPVTVLTEAESIVHGDREKTHGEPSKNLEAIAAMWGPIFGTSVTPQQVCLAMIALKVARAVNSPSHRDHWTDIVGYVALAERCGFVKPPEVT